MIVSGNDSCVSLGGVPRQTLGVYWFLVCYNVSITAFKTMKCPLWIHWSEGPGMVEIERCVSLCYWTLVFSRFLFKSWLIEYSFYPDRSPLDYPTEVSSMNHLFPLDSLRTLACAWRGISSISVVRGSLELIIDHQLVVPMGNVSTLNLPLRLVF